MRFQTPTTIQLRRAQIVLILAALVPTVLMTPLGVVLLVVGKGSVAIVAGVLVLAFCTSAVSGYVLGSIFVARGRSLALVQTDFLSTVSHELRTPLTSIRMFIDTLRQERVTDPGERAKCLAIIDQEMQRLDGLVAKLLELSRLESGGRLLDRAPVDVADVLADAMQAFDAVTLGTDVDVASEVEPGLLVTGDRAALAQALVNLLTNAWKYGPEQGKVIRVRARAASNRRVEIAVRDNGPGIPPSEQRKIFEPFERGKTALDSRKGGMGLGLTIVRAIVRMHRGAIVVESAAGKGTEIRLLLPGHAQPAARDEEDEAA